MGKAPATCVAPPKDRKQRQRAAATRGQRQPTGTPEVADATPHDSAPLVWGASALSGPRRWPRFLALGWATHVAWDRAIPRPVPSYVPDWWAPFCAVFDLVVAARAVQLARRAA